MGSGHVAHQLLAETSISELEGIGFSPPMLHRASTRLAPFAERARLPEADLRQLNQQRR